jgi:hypothetical protein
MKRKAYIISILALALSACEMISSPPSASTDAQLQETEGPMPSTEVVVAAPSVNIDGFNCQMAVAMNLLSSQPGYFTCDDVGDSLAEQTEGAGMRYHDPDWVVDAVSMFFAENNYPFEILYVPGATEEDLMDTFSGERIAIVTIETPDFIHALVVGGYDPSGGGFQFLDTLNVDPSRLKNETDILEEYGVDFSQGWRDTYMISMTDPDWVPGDGSSSGTTVGSQEGMAHIEIENTLSSPICYVYIAEFPSAPEGDADEWGVGWGENRVPEGQILAQGDSLSGITIPTGLYDLKFEDCDHNVLVWNFLVEIPGGDINIAFEQSEDYLTIINASSEPICAFRMLPADIHGWGGRSLMDEDNPIDLGESRVFYDPMAGVDRWNLLVESCDGQVVERLDTPITGSTEWTIIDQP